MASRTRVVLDLVGPYTRYGRPVIDACLDGGAHYADLTGELPFVREIIDAHHERAAAGGGQARPGVRLRGPAGGPAGGASWPSWRPLSRATACAAWTSRSR